MFIADVEVDIEVEVDVGLMDETNVGWVCWGDVSIGSVSISL